MIKVFVIDDSAVVRNSFVNIFDKVNGIKLIGDAENPVDAFKVFENVGLPDVFILDIEMPKVTGLEVAEYIKLANNNQSIILLTAYDDYEYMTDALALEIDDYLLKPIIEKDFLEKLYEITKKISDNKNNLNDIKI